MSIHGFVDQNGQIQKYDYDDLENKPTIPAEVLIDDTLTEQGQAADAKAVGDALDNITIPVDSTLTQQGAAADAKAVGDAIPSIDSTLTQQGAAADAKAVGDAIDGIGPGIDVNKLDLAVNPDDHILYHYYNGQFIGIGVSWPVEYVSPQEVSISESEIAFTSLGDEVVLTAVISPENATNRIVLWSSSDDSVATVSSDGIVTSIADGTAVITASTCFGEVASACNVKVRVPVPLPDAFAEYAALNNTGNGIMDTTANTWKDLSGNGYDLDLTMKNGVTGQVSRKYTSYDQDNGLGFGWDTVRKACYLRHQSGTQGPFVSPGKTNLTGFSAVLAIPNRYSSASYATLVKFISASSYDGTSERYNKDASVLFDPNYKPGRTFGGVNEDNPKISANSIIVFTEDSSGNYKWYRNGSVIISGNEGATTISVRHMQFVQRLCVAICYMAFYDTVLTEQQIKYITETIDEEYDCASIKSVQANITSSGTVPPYMDFYVQPKAYPLSKDASTTKSMTISDNTVLEVVT